MMQEREGGEKGEREKIKQWEVVNEDLWYKSGFPHLPC